MTRILSARHDRVQRRLSPLSYHFSARPAFDDAYFGPLEVDGPGGPSHCIPVSNLPQISLLNPQTKCLGCRISNSKARLYRLTLEASINCLVNILDYYG